MEPLHPIQREIMRLMALRQAPHYSDIKPADVDGNLFMYHLNELMRDGYIKKAGKEYRLTVRGKRHVAIISVDTGLPRLQPKIVAMIYARNDGGEYLLFRWKRQPFMGSVSLPYGKTWLGEPILKMAERELTMKTGLSGSLAHVGDAYLSVREDDELLSHMLAHIFTLADWNGTPRSSVATGECFWGAVSDIPAEERAPGLEDIIAAVEGNAGRHFCVELTAER